MVLETAGAVSPAQSLCVNTSLEERRDIRRWTSLLLIFRSQSLVSGYLAREWGADPEINSG